MPARSRSRSGLGLAAVGLMLGLAACSPRGDEPAAPPVEPPPVVAPAPPTTPAVALPPPPLGRAELLDAVAAAASAFAAGQPYPEAAGELVGRRFELRTPLGCESAPAGGNVSYAFDAAQEALKLSARPVVWTEPAWAEALSGSADVEAVEGFWIRRPWLREAACPSPSTVTGLGSAPESVGLAQVFDAEGSRVLRRGDRPYEVTRKTSVNEQPQPGALSLVLQGRVVESAGGQPIRCQSAGTDQRPTCLMRVEFDRVAFTDGSGAVLAEWVS